MPRIKTKDDSLIFIFSVTLQCKSKHSFEVLIDFIGGSIYIRYFHPCPSRVVSGIYFLPPKLRRMSLVWEHSLSFAALVEQDGV